MAKKILCFFCVVVLLFLAGCQTIAGLGRDIQWSAETAAELLESAEY